MLVIILFDMYSFVCEGQLRVVNKRPALRHVVPSDSLTSKQIFLGLLLYGAVVILGTLFFAVLLKSLEDISTLRAQAEYTNLFFNIENRVNFDLILIQTNSTKTNVLKFFTDTGVSRLSEVEYKLIWSFFNLELGLPLPAVSKEATLQINYFIVYFYILVLIIWLFIFYWFFVGRTFIPTAAKPAAKKTLLKNRNLLFNSRRSLYTNFRRNMHTGDSSNFISIFLETYNGNVAELQQSSPIKIQKLRWVLSTLHLDINDFTNTFYIRNILNMLNRDISLAQIVYRMGTMLASGQHALYVQAFADLRGITSRIGLLTDAINIRAVRLQTPTVPLFRGRVLPSSRIEVSTVTPRVERARIVDLPPIETTSTTILEAPEPKPWSIWDVVFIAIFGTVILYFSAILVKNIYLTYKIEHFDFDIVFKELLNEKEISSLNKLYTSLQTNTTKQTVLDFFTVKPDQQFILIHHKVSKPASTFLDIVYCTNFWFYLVCLLFIFLILYFIFSEEPPYEFKTTSTKND